MTSAGVAPALAGLARCASCRAELPPTMLSCPACRTLVHAARLKELAAEADAGEAAGRLEDARAALAGMLDLLPPTSHQHGAVLARLTDVAKRIEAGMPRAGDRARGHSGWKRWGALIAALAIFALTKAKFLVLGLTKASTFVSMFAFFGVYWTAFGWALALGLVVSIYIHEMGHVHEIRRLGIAAGAPLFIPGLGALVLLKQHIADPLDDARVGLAGPIWGLGAGVAAYLVYLATDAPVWAAIAQITGFINLFNLIPIWQLDGSRGFHALARWQRIAVVAAIALTWAVTGQKLLLLIGAVALYRVFQRGVAPTARHPVLAVFVVLVAAHSALAAIPALPTR